jgi:hypothetical protein
MAALHARERAREFVKPALVVGFAVLLLFSPIPWPCPMRTFIHVPCPTCGMTRAARFALHGDLASATRLHPLWFVVLPALVMVGVGEVIGFARTGAWGRVTQHRWTARVGAVVVLALIVVGIARFAGAFGGPAPAG